MKADDGVSLTTKANNTLCKGINTGTEIRSILPTYNPTITKL